MADNVVTRTMGPFRMTAEGVRVTLRVTPKAARDAVTGLKATAEGGQVLAVSVTAAPEDGRANMAVLRLLAKAWSLAKTDLRVVAGATDRNKVIAVAGEPQAMFQLLTAWMAGIIRERGAETAKTRS